MADPAEDEVVVEEEQSLRDVISASMDEVEKETPPEVKPPEVKPPEGETKPPETETKPPEGEVKPPEGEVKPPEGAAPAAPAELKAPAQWKPAVREKWNALPREVKEEIIRREGDSMRLIGSVGPKIRLADEVGQHLSEFLPQLQQAGIQPSAFIGDLFASVKALSKGNPMERAETIANIVQSYGVDLKVLDHVLTQRIQAGPNDAAARRAMAQAQAVLQQQKQGQQQQTEVQTQKALAAFAADPKHEFLDDVRDLMADLIEAGRAKTLEDAYAAAIWAHGDTRKILLQRDAEARAAAKGQRANAARRASSAVHGSPTTSGAAGNENLTLRETISQAFEEHSNL